MKSLVFRATSIFCCYLFAVACATQPKPRELAWPDPPDFDVEEQEANEDLGEPATPLMQGDVAPFSGVLFSEARAVLAITDAAEVRRLRVENQIRGQLFEYTSALLKNENTNLRLELSEARRPSRWDRIQGPFFLFLGLVLGGAFGYGIYRTALSGDGDI